MDVDVMDCSDTSSTGKYYGFQELTVKALEANKAHQYALTKHAEWLTAELQKMDKLMVRLYLRYDSACAPTIAIRQL